MRKVLLSLLALLAAGPVGADIFGRYSLPGDNTLDIYYRDDGNIRVNLEGQGYTLFSSGGMFLVMQQGGMQIAVDLRQMGSIVSGWRDQAIGKGTDSSKLVPKIKATGRQVVVAGYEGQVHEVVVDQNRTELVLTKNADVGKVTDALVTAAYRIGEVMGPEDSKALGAAITQLEETGYTGLLKQSDGVILEFIKTVDRPESFYRLPPNTPLLQMPMTQ